MIIKKTAIILWLMLLSCNDSREIIWEISNPANKTEKKIVLDKVYGQHSLEIIENTLNYTCRIGLFFIPPKKTGTAYTLELYGTTVDYEYIPYKATTGKLKLKIVFYN